MRALLFASLVALFYLVRCHQREEHSNAAHKMHNSKMAQDFDHIVEHLKEKINVKKELSAEELEFYYFMEHDFNNDSRLDGLEIMSAIRHSELASELHVDTKNLYGQELKRAHHKEIEYYADIVDEILDEDDSNNDGYLSYLEYVLARRREQSFDQKEHNGQNKNPRQTKRTN